jgi:aminoglycoside phosphotransferase (APT) family kinase protein
MAGNTSEIRPIELDEDDLALAVADMLSAAQGRPVRVQGLKRQPSEFATLFPAEILWVSLDDGAELRLFLKHLGPEQPGQPDKQRRDREVRVYEALLRDEDLPVPKYYGSRRNAATGRLELYLEYIDDWPLKYHGLEHWATAAQRLASFHSHFAARAEALRACDFLLRLDGAYFAAWAQRALVALADQSAELAAQLKGVIIGYGAACELLAAQPVTLVHNDLAPKNVLADRTHTPARICLIDWEMAGVGCGLLDLVHLKYGLGPERGQELVAAYRSGLQTTELLPEDDQVLARVLAACELHKTFYRLAHSTSWNLPLATLAQWVTEAQEFLRHVRRGGDK